MPSHSLCCSLQIKVKLQRQSRRKRPRKPVPRLSAGTAGRCVNILPISPSFVLEKKMMFLLLLFVMARIKILNY